MSRLELRGVSKAYGGVTAVDCLALDVPSGSRTAIVGPSGCGKTTLLRLIAGFDAPDAGRVVLDGLVIADGAEFMPAHRRRIGIVMQDGALFPHLSVADNLGFGLARQIPDRQAKLEGLMDVVGLPQPMLNRRPDQLSGGQQQRVALARSLAREPQLMLLDEPFSALDAGLRAATRDAIADLLAARGITTVLVTHDQTEALGFADQVAVMRDGRIVRVGSPRDVYLRPREVKVASFLGEAVLLVAEMVCGRAVCLLGAVPVDACERQGMVRLMIRPEQLRLVSDVVVGSVPGQVVETRFQGAIATVRVRLDAMPEAEPLTLSVAGYQTPEVGKRVHITVEGLAHILDA